MAGAGGTVDLWAYRRFLDARYAPNTVRPRWAVAVEWCERHPDVGAATFRDVEAWIQDRRLSASSSRNLLACLRAFYRWTIREDLVAVDPTLLAETAPIPRRLPRPAPDAAIRRVAATDDPQLRALVVLMAGAGLRCVECARLDWADVDLPGGLLVVNGKGSIERRIPVGVDVVRALAALRLASGRTAGPVFVGVTGHRLRASRVSQIVNVALHAAGWTCTAHMLRHRYATTALQVPGADLLTVRDLLGHSSVATTQIYTACIPGRLDATGRAVAVPVP